LERILLISTHTVWGHAGHSLYTLHPRQRAVEELLPDDEDGITAPFVLGLWNEGGDNGLILQGSRRELPDYLSAAIDYVKRETDPRLELDQALKRLRALRQRAQALEEGNYCHIARLDEQEVGLLNDIAEAAEEVNDQL